MVDGGGGSSGVRSDGGDADPSFIFADLDMQGMYCSHEGTGTGGPLAPTSCDPNGRKGERVACVTRVERNALLIPSD